MKTWYDNNIAPAVARIDKLMGVKHIRVAYEPTQWSMDGDSFYCDHTETETEMITQQSYSYSLEDITEWEEPFEVCADCGYVQND